MDPSAFALPTMTADRSHRQYPKVNYYLHLRIRIRCLAWEDPSCLISIGAAATDDTGANVSSFMAFHVQRQLIPPGYS